LPDVFGLLSLDNEQLILLHQHVLHASQVLMVVFQLFQEAFYLDLLVNQEWRVAL